MCSAFLLGTLWITVTPRAELQGYWIASLFAHRSCWDGGILGSVPSQLRADGGVGSQWLHSGGNKLEGRMWSSSGKKRFSTAGEELGGCNRDCADAREVERVKERSGEPWKNLIYSHTGFSSLSFLFSQKSPRLLPFHFPFLSLSICICL